MSPPAEGSYLSRIEILGLACSRRGPPPEIGRLERLELEGHQLEVLPAEIGRLRQHDGKPTDPTVFKLKHDSFSLIEPEQ